VVGATDVHEQLLDLAYDVSSRLRHHTQPAIRISAALLLAASLAACGGRPPSAAQPPASGPLADVAPLQQDVSSGLPTGPGRYPLVGNSLSRDQQGVYRFAWLRPGETGAGSPATASRLRLAESSSEFLEIPQQGDPILNLQKSSVVQMSSLAGAGTPTTQSGGYHSYGYWRPFYAGTGYYGPGYYEPPVRQIPASGSTIDGARSYTVPPPAAERTTGLSRAVSGRAGGTGAGTAATARSGASTAEVGGKSAVAAPKSSSFSSGGAAASKAGGSSGGSSGSSGG
jgi:hypothetical protein